MYVACVGARLPLSCWVERSKPRYNGPLSLILEPIFLRLSLLFEFVSKKDQLGNFSCLCAGPRA